MKERGLFPSLSRKGVYVASMGKNAVAAANRLATDRRGLGIRTETDLMDRSLKAQMKYADKTGTRFVVVIGDSEVESGKITVKDMDGGDPFETTLADGANAIFDRL